MRSAILFSQANTKLHGSDLTRTAFVSVLKTCLIGGIFKTADEIASALPDTLVKKGGQG